MNVLSRFAVAAALCTAVSSAGAVTVDFDLNDGTIFVNPDPNYFSNVISLGGPVAINPGEALDILINFADQLSGAQQFLTIFDLGDPNEENFGLSIEGSNIANGAPIFDVTFTGVAGDIVATQFNSNFGDCSGGNLCVSGVFPVDLTDSRFSFQGLNIAFTLPAGQVDPATIEFVTFGFALDDPSEAHVISVVPEPGTIGLLGLGVGALGLAVRRRRA